MAESASFGPYELVARLGSGGMAEVWKATVSGPGGFARTVVLKRILPHLADDRRFADMFLSEARLSARLHHSNIVDVFACGEIDGRYFLAMEYVHGHDLVRLVNSLGAEGAPPPPGLAAFVAREICRALAYAHALADDDGRPLSIVHRDVSLSNVMVSYDGAVKLLDFGIAKALGELRNAETRVTSLAGKRGYLAPETISGRAIDGRTDQYAAGVVMHELLTGTRLFHGQDPRKPRGPVPLPSSLVPAIPKELDRICLRALETAPERRFATCEEMAAALDHAVHQLEWGPQQVAELMRRILPELRPATPVRETEPLSLPMVAQTVARADGNPEPPTTQYYAPARGLRSRRVFIGGAAGALALAGVVAWSIARCGPAPAPVVVEEPQRGAAGPSRVVVTPLGANPAGEKSAAGRRADPATEPVQPSGSADPAARADPAPGSKSGRGPGSRPHAKNPRHPPRTNLLKGDVLDPFQK